MSRPNVCQDSGTVNDSEDCTSEEFQGEHGKRMKHLDDLQKQLLQMKKKLTEASVRCHTLNLDVATMYNPQTLETLENYKEECEKCLGRMSRTLNESIDMGIPSGEKPLTQNAAN